MSRHWQDAFNAIAISLPSIGEAGDEAAGGATCQADDGDGTGLAQAVAAVLGLAVDLGVEVHVVQDDGVRPRQVQALAPGARAQQEGEDTVLLVVEPATVIWDMGYSAGLVTLPCSLGDRTGSGRRGAVANGA